MTKQIPLSRGLVAIVDDADFAVLGGFLWHAREVVKAPGTFYAGRSIAVTDLDGRRRMTVREMHREIMDPEMKLPRDVLCDHRNHDTLDNRRDNLRLVDHRTSVLNRRLFKNNTSGYRGVYFDQERGFYCAKLYSLGVNYLSKGHTTAEDAASAYNWFALIHHGEHAKLNLGPDGLPLPPRKHRFTPEQTELSI